MAYEYKVKEVLRVVDGDTIDVLIDLGFGLTKKERVRVAGIDTPESRTRDLDEKKYGLLAKDYLRRAANAAGGCNLKSHERGKFGRILGSLYNDESGKSINEKMVEHHHAVPYHGQSKDDIAKQHIENRKKHEEGGLAI